MSAKILLQGKVQNKNKQARKAPSYASSKLRLTDLLTDGGEMGEMGETNFTFGPIPKLDFFVF